MARLLSLYQLWLDDLYPKAKFADALAIIEKLGHTKRMQVMRREWIDESKTRNGVYDAPASADVNLDAAVPASRADEPAKSRAQTPPPHHTADDGDLNSASPVAARVDRAMPSATGAVEELPEEDELDALLAEDAARTAPAMHTRPASKPPAPARVAPPPEDDFDDEMEAMADMDGMW